MNTPEWLIITILVYSFIQWFKNIDWLLDAFHDWIHTPTTNGKPYQLPQSPGPRPEHIPPEIWWNWPSRLCIDCGWIAVTANGREEVICTQPCGRHR